MHRLVLPRNVWGFVPVRSGAKLLERGLVLTEGKELIVDQLEIMSWDHRDKLAFETHNIGIDGERIYVLAQEIDDRAMRVSYEWFAAYAASVLEKDEKKRVAATERERELREVTMNSMRSHMRPQLKVV